MLRAWSAFTGTSIPGSSYRPVQTFLDEERDSNIVVRPLKEVFRIEPLYTDEARQAGTEGTVVLLVEVALNGFVEKARILRSLGYGLDEATVSAVQNWQFESPQVSNPSTWVATLIPLHFKLSLGPSAPGKAALFFFNVDDSIKPPKVLSRAEPTYTEEARSAKLRGVVLLYVEVTDDGQVAGVQVLRDIGKGLGTSAAQALKQWTFQPAIRDGAPVGLILPVEVNFSLSSDNPEP